MKKYLPFLILMNIGLLAQCQTIVDTLLAKHLNIIWLPSAEKSISCKQKSIDGTTKSYIFSNINKSDSLFSGVPEEVGESDFFNSSGQKIAVSYSKLLPPPLIKVDTINIYDPKSDKSGLRFVASIVYDDKVLIYDKQWLLDTIKVNIYSITGKLDTIIDVYKHSFSEFVWDIYFNDKKPKIELLYKPLIKIRPTIRDVAVNYEKEQVKVAKNENLPKYFLVFPDVSYSTSHQFGYSINPSCKEKSIPITAQNNGFVLTRVILDKNGYYLKHIILDYNDVKQRDIVQKYVPHFSYSQAQINGRNVVSRLILLFTFREGEIVEVKCIE